MQQSHVLDSSPTRTQARHMAMPFFLVGRLATCFSGGLSPLRVPDDITYMSCLRKLWRRKTKQYPQSAKSTQGPDADLDGVFFFFGHWRESTASYRPALIGHRTSKRSTFFRSPSRTQPGRISDSKRHKKRRCAISLVNRGTRAGQNENKSGEG